jgi:menaquinone-dependent protoporphyrinogen oxidase
VRKQITPTGRRVTGIVQGVDEMKILVAYETGHGSTEEIAEKMAEVLRQNGAEADLLRCRQAEDISGYDAFVLGSPIWANNTLGPFRAFVRKHSEELADKPKALFVTSGAAQNEKGKLQIENDVIPKVLASLSGDEPVAVGNFGGVIDFDKYAFGMRLVMKGIAKVVGGPTSGRHDYRDWDEISAWAKSVLDAFAQGHDGQSGD